MKNYRTTSTAIAAFLTCNGFDLLECEIVGPDQCEFVFLDPDQRCASTVSTYYANATVPARTFWKAVQDTRTLLSQTLRRKRLGIAVGKPLGGGQ